MSVIGAPPTQIWANRGKLKRVTRPSGRTLISAICIPIAAHADFAFEKVVAGRREKQRFEGHTVFVTVAVTMF